MTIVSRDPLGQRVVSDPQTTRDEYTHLLFRLLPTDVLLAWWRWVMSDTKVSAILKIHNSDG